MSSQPYDFLPARRRAQDKAPVSEDSTHGAAVHAGGLLAGSALSAAVGIFLARRRRKEAGTLIKVPVTTVELATRPVATVAKVAKLVPAAQHSLKGRHTPGGLERAIRIATVLLPLLAAWRRGTARKAELGRAKTTPAPGEAEHKPRISNIHAQLAPAPADYLDPAAEVKMLQGGSRVQQAWQLTQAAINAWLDDFAPSMGAAIAYYTIFSIAPMLVIAIAVAGMIFGHEAAQGEIVNQIRDIVGTEGAFAIQGLLKSVSEPREGMIAAAISVVTLAVGATAVFAELQSALDRIWRIPAIKRKSGLWFLVRTRLLSFGLILGLGFLLIISLVVSAALAALGRWWGGWFEGWQLVLQALNFALSFIVFSTLFSLIYKFMPRVSLSWRDVWIGAAATTVLFIIGKYLIGLYLGHTGMTSGFGAAGSFALLLAWIYYSAQIFLLGAEFTWIYANNYGSRASRQKLVITATDPIDTRKGTS